MWQMPTFFTIKTPGLLDKNSASWWPIWLPSLSWWLMRISLIGVLLLSQEPCGTRGQGLRLGEAHKHWGKESMDWFKHTDSLLQWFHGQGHSRHGPTAPEGISAFSRATQIRNKQIQQAAKTSEVLWFQRVVGQDLCLRLSSWFCAIPRTFAAAHYPQTDSGLIFAGTSFILG